MARVPSVEIARARAPSPQAVVVVRSKLAPPEAVPCVYVEEDRDWRSRARESRVREGSEPASVQVARLRPRPPVASVEPDEDSDHGLAMGLAPRRVRASPRSLGHVVELAASALILVSAYLICVTMATSVNVPLSNRTILDEQSGITPTPSPPASSGAPSPAPPSVLARMPLFAHPLLAHMKAAMKRVHRP
jgi:hypothetical protein